jgi:hypothetical protein
MSQDRRRALYAAQVRSSKRDQPKPPDPDAAMKVPLAKERMRKRLAAAEQASDFELAAELRRLLAELERAFPD